ncbi:MAG: Asp-tRNA(Asn)/Glu-tRNA(Gln) amidotransferase subunit GatB, partial [Candidatus Heimdallarchaeota archaeon]|nr:Asp-tRNA(Asn)/Glu-tRNA(Gln) amidotransferase subunit GatB [Candidatus Heimdallarchaeota archaeon]
MYKIVGKNGQEWRVVIGLEVHAQIISNAKLFSKSSNSFDNKPNANVSFFDMALPGTLPVINTQCINQAIKAGKAINGTIEKYSRFDRKNYFYPDLPSGYQISQFFHPIVTNGELDIDLEDGSTKNIRIERIHMEQDAGKSIHLNNSNKTYIDLNRSGVGLMEIVSYPDISSPYEAAAYLKKLRLILKYIGVCDGSMECGSLRCDANVSVCHIDSTTLGTRCEIKNLNSMRYIMQAIEYEANSQVEAIENGEEIIQSTKSFNVETGETKVLRKKEEASEYRYFPEPDLLPIILTDERINDALKDFPELPDIKKKRYINDLKLSKADADLITSERMTVDYFENAICGIENDAKTLA